MWRFAYKIRRILHQNPSKFWILRNFHAIFTQFLGKFCAIFSSTFFGEVKNQGRWKKVCFWRDLNEIYRLTQEKILTAKYFIKIFIKNFLVFVQNFRKNLRNFRKIWEIEICQIQYFRNLKISKSSIFKILNFQNPVFSNLEFPKSDIFKILNFQNRVFSKSWISKIQYFQNPEFRSGKFTVADRTII